MFRTITTKIARCSTCRFSATGTTPSTSLIILLQQFQYRYFGSIPTTKACKVQQQRLLPNNNSNSNNNNINNVAITMPATTTNNTNRQQQQQQHRRTMSTTTTIDATSNDTTRVLIVGSGIIGLRTAWELLVSQESSKNKIEIVLCSKYPPLDERNCSIGAGGLWMPYHVASTDPQRLNRWALDTFNEYYPWAMDPTNDLAEIIPTIQLFRSKNYAIALDEYDKHDDKNNSSLSSSSSVVVQNDVPGWLEQDERLKFQAMPIEMLVWQNTMYQLKIPSQPTLLEAGYTYAWLFHPPIVNVPRMTEYLLEQITNHPNTIDLNLNLQKPYTTVDEIVEDAKTKYNCSIIINCTGLGAASICNDTTVKPVRGILHYYKRSECVRQLDVQRCPVYGQENVHDATILVEEPPWAPFHDESCYIIPRGDTIVIGGSAGLDDTEATIRPKEQERLRRNASYLGIDTNVVQPYKEWVGYRPYRQHDIRCEIDTTGSYTIPIIHNYGYGGSGWTLNVGAAKDVAQMVQSIIIEKTTTQK